MPDAIPPAQQTDSDADREARLANIRWFSQLSPSEKIRVMEMHNRATSRLRQLRGDRR